MFTHMSKTTSRTDCFNGKHSAALQSPSASVLAQLYSSTVTVSEHAIRLPGVTVPRADTWTCQNVHFYEFYKGASVHNPQVFRSHLSLRDFLGTGQSIIATYCFTTQIGFPNL